MNIMNPLVSVVIPVKNRKNDALECLSSLQKQTYRNFEVLIIDDGSRESIAGFLEGNYKDLKVIRNKQSRGAAYAKNQGIMQSTGEYVWFLDSDTIVSNNRCLENMLNRIRNDEKVGSIGGELLGNNKYVYSKSRFTNINKR